jgi:hypothetical protein
VIGVDADEHISMLVRPYALTGGRTRPDVDIAIETLLITTPYGRTGSRTHQQGSLEQTVLSLCRHRPLSLAEVAALARLPLGVARILVSDLVTAGLVSLAGQTLAKNHTTDVLGRLLRGLRSL